MTTSLRTPDAPDLTAVGEVLDPWQQDVDHLQLHPGDLGWFSMRGASATAAALRTWTRDDDVVAVGLLDGADLLRMALDPRVRDDDAVATAIAADLADPGRGVLPAGEAVVEARGATALARALGDAGWEPDDPWTPFHLDLTDPLPERPGQERVVVQVTGDDQLVGWVGAHWSAFKGTALDDTDRDVFVGRLRTMLDGPFGGRGTLIAALDDRGEVAAVSAVWSAGPGRPGLVEPMGVHRDHRGRGYGAAVSGAAAAALRERGSSSAIVCTETSNAGAVATFAAAGFVPGTPVADLVRSEPAS